MAPSDYAQMQQRIADEYQAAQWGLSGLASGTSRHQFITARMENMGGTFEELTELVESPEKAIEIINDTIEALPETPTRVQFVDILQRMLGNTEETTWLIESIEELWETVDMLTQRFGIEQVKKIVALPSSPTSEKEEEPLH